MFFCLFKARTFAGRVIYLLTDGEYFNRSRQKQSFEIGRRVSGQRANCSRITNFSCSFDAKIFGVVYVAVWYACARTTISLMRFNFKKPIFSQLQDPPVTLSSPPTHPAVQAALHTTAPHQCYATLRQTRSNVCFSLSLFQAQGTILLVPSHTSTSLWFFTPPPVITYPLVEVNTANSRHPCHCPSPSLRNPQKAESSRGERRAVYQNSL
jgi:hypothetical protein